MNLIKSLSILVTLGIVLMTGCSTDDDNDVDVVSGPGPTVVSTNPASDATGVLRDTDVVFSFSEEMDPSTINSATFLLQIGTQLVPGKVVYSGTTATFTPDEPLLAGKPYTATITTGAKDTNGRPLTPRKVWQFVTAGPSTPTLGAVALGAAGKYVILAKSAITNSSTSGITGDLGLSPAATSYITGLDLANATGYATSSQVNGKIFAADMPNPIPATLTTAVGNMLTAYNDAAGRPTPEFIEFGDGNLGGKTLPAGLYKWTSDLTLPSNVTLSGNDKEVWIFQISGDLIVSPAVRVMLSGGAQPKNIFWQVAGQATVGAAAHMEGIILSNTGITFQTGSSLRGRALAQTAVVLDANTVTGPDPQ